MPIALYEVIPHQSGWGLRHDGEIAGPYATKEAALESAVGAASNAIKQGMGVTIEVPGRESGTALGAH